MLKVLEGNYENKEGQGGKGRTYVFDEKAAVVLKSAKITAENPKWPKILGRATETFGKKTYLSWFSNYSLLFPM